MSDPIPNRQRAEDSLLRIWAPILFPIIAIAAAWGTMTTQLNSLQTTQQAIVIDVRTLSESRIRADVAASELQRRVNESAVTRGVISDLALEIGKIKATLNTHGSRIDQVWPRLRALDKNATLLARVIERLHTGTTIPLEEPQKF